MIKIEQRIVIFITIPILSFGYILFLGIENILKKEGDVMSKAEFNMLKQFREKTVNGLDSLIYNIPILIPQTKEEVNAMGEEETEND